MSNLCEWCNKEKVQKIYNRETEEWSCPGCEDDSCSCEHSCCVNDYGRYCKCFRIKRRCFECLKNDIADHDWMFMFGSDVENSVCDAVEFHEKWYYLAQQDAILGKPLPNFEISQQRGRHQNYNLIFAKQLKNQYLLGYNSVTRTKSAAEN